MNTLRDRSFSPSSAAWLPRMLLTLCLGLWALAGLAQTDPPGRVGRLADARGAVSWWDQETGRWAEAERNQPLTGGDRVSTAAGGSAELRVGSTVLRLGASTELEVLRLDDERLAFQLHSGSVALRVRSREIADEIELVTAEVQLAPLSAGHFRLDRTDDTTQASSWRGDLRINDPAGFVVTTGQRVSLFRERRTQALRFQMGVPVNDRYAEAVQREGQRVDQEDERSVSARYVSPEMTGVEELDRNGRWEQHPEYGAVWLPLTVTAGWAPYSDGRWTWVQPWGWTWVDNARWGFAPFHYGRWAYWRNAWCWVPGAYVARPVYAPALVAWAGGRPGNGVRIGVRITGPSIGWLPLAPRDVYVPHHRVTPGYRERVNPVRDQRDFRDQRDQRDQRDHRDQRNQRDQRPEREGPVVRGNPGLPQTAPLPPQRVEPPRQTGGREEREGRDGRDGRDGREDRNPRGPTPTPAAVAVPAGPVGPPVSRAQPAVQPAPQPAPPPAAQPAPPPSPRAAPPAPTPAQVGPPAPAAAVPKPAVQRQREAEPERPRDRRSNDRENEK